MRFTWLGLLVCLVACSPKPVQRAATSRVEPAPSAPLTTPAAEVLSRTGAGWVVQASEPFKGKQDDVVFADEKHGWYGNGRGYIYATADGGQTWTRATHMPGTFVRALAHVEGNRLYAGNIGPDYFPGVTDSTPLYTSEDGGRTWRPVEGVTKEMIKGVCAIDVLKSQYVNRGQLASRVTIRAGGRVGGPARLVTSRDDGKTWTSSDLSAVASMILDIKFVDELTGFICSASDSSIETSHARILKTTDGGDSWNIVYESKRPFEITWKCDFPSKDVGYASIQSYNPDPAASQRFVAKTVDGGDTWTEVPLTDDISVREFGIGFADANTGWVGAIDGLWQTTDGGASWSHIEVGRAINKIRVLQSDGGFIAYAIGAELLRLEALEPPARGSR